MERRYGVTRDNLYKLARGTHWTHTLPASAGQEG